MGKKALEKLVPDFKGFAKDGEGAKTTEAAGEMATALTCGCG